MDARAHTLRNKKLLHQFPFKEKVLSKVIDGNLSVAWLC